MKPKCFQRLLFVGYVAFKSNWYQLKGKFGEVATGFYSFFNVCDYWNAAVLFRLVLSVDTSRIK